MKYLITAFILTMMLSSINTNAKKAQNIQVVDVKSMFILYVQDTTTTKGEDIGQAFGTAYSEIVGFMQKNGIQFAGMPIAINIVWDMEKDIFVFKAGIPVAEGDYKLTGNVQYEKTFEGKAIKAVHIGPYNEAGPVYEAITKYAKENGHEVTNESWEQYMNDPSQVKPKALETHIYMGIKK